MEKLIPDQQFKLMLEIGRLRETVRACIHALIVNGVEIAAIVNRPDVQRALSHADERVVE